MVSFIPGFPEIFARILGRHTFPLPTEYHDINCNYELVCKGIWIIESHLPSLRSRFFYVDSTLLLLSSRFFFVAGILISTLGCCIWLISQLSHLIPYGRNNILKRRLFRTLSLRELEYLDLIKRKDITKYGDVMRRLRDERFRHININKDHDVGLADEMELDKFISSLILWSIKELTF